MTAVSPCYRHPRGVWLGSCSDCTAWYLPIAIGRRDDVVVSSVVVPLHRTRLAATAGEGNAA